MKENHKLSPILIVGGAGYIGSHTARHLKRMGYEVIVFDNLSTGNIKNIPGIQFVQGDLSDSSALDLLFKENKFIGVFHFAAQKSIEDSVSDPLQCYVKNICPTLTLLEKMQKYGVKYFIFSSSAAVFGLPQSDLISEEHPNLPINPYGKSKLMIEEILTDMKKDPGFKYISLRYFNAAGTDPQESLISFSESEKNVIPVLLRGVKNNTPFLLFGQDYETCDGTCIRDYVHVCDLAEAHRLAFEKLLSGASSTIYNLGTGKGFSVLEVIDAVEQVTGKKIHVIPSARRLGDPPILIANGTKAYKELAWKPKYTDLKTIISHMWK